MGGGWRVVQWPPSRQQQSPCGWPIACWVGGVLDFIAYPGFKKNKETNCFRMGNLEMIQH